MYVRDTERNRERSTIVKREDSVLRIRVCFLFYSHYDRTELQKCPTEAHSWRPIWLDIMIKSKKTQWFIGRPKKLDFEEWECGPKFDRFPIEEKEKKRKKRSKYHITLQIFMWVMSIILIIFLFKIISIINLWTNLGNKKKL